jgi:hypothetical protein
MGIHTKTPHKRKVDVYAWDVSVSDDLRSPITTKYTNLSLLTGVQFNKNYNSKIKAVIFNILIDIVITILSLYNKFLKCVNSIVRANHKEHLLT